MTGWTAAARRVLGDPAAFAEQVSRLRLRRYQQEVIRAVADSVLHRRGSSFVVLFPRQSGKNEIQAQLEVYLLAALSHQGAEIVKISPTWRPQSLNAMRRLERVLRGNWFTASRWQKESGYIYRVGMARIFFFSGSPAANIVGATASTLLEVDEAQDVGIDKYDRDIAPMAASTNATRVFWGTAWDSATLLARELRAARQVEAETGQRRAFVLTADDVSREVPAYGQFVAAQVARLGRSHPMVRTQYYSEEIDGSGGMFPAARAAAMRGSHPALPGPLEGRIYALLVDVGGPQASRLDDQSPLPGLEGLAPPSAPARDATAATVVEVDLSGVADPALRAPVYRVMARQAWVGTEHTRLYAQIRLLAEHWRARRVVVDATGVGAGLASFLERALTGRVARFTFSSASKSKLGWDFLAVVDTGRWQEFSPDGAPPDQEALQRLFFQQVEHCQYEVLPGPACSLRWGVPDGRRDPASGRPVHDDLLISAALAAVLDGETWPAGASAAPRIVRAPDPLDSMTGF